MKNENRDIHFSTNETKGSFFRIRAVWSFCVKKPIVAAFGVCGIVAFLYLACFALVNFEVVSVKNDNHVSEAQKKEGLFRRIFAKKPVVAVLKLYGEIGMGRGSLNLNSIGDDIDKAFSIKNLSAVCLLINSPGGSPVQSDLIASRIISLSQKNKVPVYSFVEDVGASGGYWIACAGDKIFSSSGSIVGSIGVISSSFGMVEAAKKLGIERRIYSQGKNKVGMDAFLPVDPEKIARVNDIGAKMHNIFIEYVRSRRGDRLDVAGKVDLFDGNYWVGSDGLKFGLIDGIQSLHDFIESEFGSKVSIQFIKKKEPWMKRSFGIDNILDDISGCIRSSIQEMFVGKWF